MLRLPPVSNAFACPETDIRQKPLFPDTIFNGGEDSIFLANRSFQFIFSKTTFLGVICEQLLRLDW